MKLMAMQLLSAQCILHFFEVKHVIK